jgi:hypothetical protein
MQRFGMSTREIAKVTGTASTVVYTMPQVGHIGLTRLVVVSREPNRGGGLARRATCPTRPVPWQQSEGGHQRRILIRRERDPNALPGWAVQFLTDTAPDVPRKLAASGYPERQAFIWATVTTPHEIASILDGDALPTEAPDLPDGVTHLWVGG